MTSNVSEIKKSGATFTPEGLANFLALKLFALAQEHGMNGMTVLDPACGDGALLNAMYNVGKERIGSLLGYDTNQNYLAESSRLLAQSPCVLTCSDFLSICPNNVDLFSTGARSEFADMVIANPPYVRTQVLGADKAQQLARDFGLSGRIDLYYPFLMAMTNALKKGGLLGVITSNRYISTKSGGDIRKYLLEHYDIIEVIDLGDTKLFDAAVLPAIFIGRKKESKSSVSKSGKYVSIYESEGKDTNAEHRNSVYEILQNGIAGEYATNGTNYVFKSGLLKHSADKTGIWQMSNDTENRWVETVNANTSFRVKDKFKVRVGIKSCADDVFISQQWEKEGCAIEGELLRCMISQENIEAWKIHTGSLASILYPHYSANGKRQVFDISKYPVAASYLEHHRKQLEGRNYVIKAGRKWYEYWVPQNPALWTCPKVVFPDISVKPRFCYDESGAIVNGNCYWICAQNEEEKNLLMLIEGVANSDVMIRYHDLCFNNKLYSGRRRYLTQYIEQYPMPDPQSNHAQDIIKLVREINCSNDDAETTRLSMLINEKVKMAFKLSD